jgi:hypothetical protein
MYRQKPRGLASMRGVSMQAGEGENIAASDREVETI